MRCLTFDQVLIGLVNCMLHGQAAAREANALRLPGKRPAKKKTIAVLKDEENKLLIERTNLENDIESLMKTYLSLVKQNKRLKMIKLPPKDVSNGKPDIVASIASEQAPQEAVLPAEAADFDHVAPRSASDAKPDFLTMGAAMHEVHDSALLKDTEPLSKTANATLQSHAAKETCSVSSVPSCGEAFFIPDLNLPIDVSFAGDAA
ncbi:hypothetical protein EJ110_NYTH40918 [Nymphaea thermarum]|nr:hypothetical protein EJ110_NYTH40918 [Nymphaea thermarum]